MNASIRRVGLAVTVLMLALVGQLTYLQVVDAHKLANDPRNIRKIVAEYEHPRGEILTSDGQIVARSVPATDEFKFQRTYPLGALFAQISGWQSFVIGNSGVEQTYNDVLLGRKKNVKLENLPELLLGKKQVDNVVLSVSAKLQTVARDALGTQPGSVIALDPRSGAILALYSNPSFDPQPLAGHQTTQVNQAYAALRPRSASSPAIARAFRELYPPGSTFKVITTSVGLETGLVTPDTQYPTLKELPLPLTRGLTVANFGHEPCGGTLTDSFVQSCNTTFARLGLDLGEQLAPGAAHFGIGAAPPLDVTPFPVRSTGPEAGTFKTAAPQFALAGIGQGPDAVTPLQMALVAAAIANHGVIMTPHVGAQVTDQDGKTVESIKPRTWLTAVPDSVATELTAMMEQVVARGTGTPAQISGVAVAGKTGTAQVDTGSPHAWFIAFAPADAPSVAVAVIVEHGGRFQREATGGQVAAPIARKVLMAALGLQ